MESYESIYLYRRIVKAKLFIDEHYADRLNLEEISGQSCFSKFHFIRLFKSIYGKTPNQYLSKVRIDRAQLLLAGGHSVQDVTMAVGFESTTSFAGLFKKYVGHSPSAFQQKQEMKKVHLLQNPLAFVPNCFAETHGWVK